MSENKQDVALVVGARGGIGTALASHFAQKSMSLGLLSQNWEDIADQVKELGEYTKVSGFGVDVNSVGVVPVAIERIVAELGVPKIVVHSASSVGQLDPLHQCDTQKWSETVGTNLVGAFNVFKAVLPYMIEKQSGTIVAIATGFSHKPYKDWSAYCVGKAGLGMMIRSIDKEYRDLGIKAYSLLPGDVDTQERLERGTALMPKGASPAYATDVAKIISWLNTEKPDQWLGGEVDADDPEIRKAAGI